MLKNNETPFSVYTINDDCYYKYAPGYCLEYLIVNVQTYNV